MSFTPLPMDVNRPVLWLVAFVAIVVGGAGLGVGWSKAQVSLVEVEVADSGIDAPVEIALARSEDGRFRTVREATLNASDDARVRWTVRDTGWYRLRLASDGRTCDRRVSVQRSDGGLAGELVLADDDTCPDVRVQVR